MALANQHTNTLLSSKHLEVPGNGDGLFFFHNVPESHRPGDIHRRFWDGWIQQFCQYGSSCSEHEHCWGNTILRTSYDDDEKFARAVATIRHLAMVPIQYDYDQRGTGPVRDQPVEDDGPEADEEIRSDMVTRDPLPTKLLQDAYQNMVRRAKANLPPGVRCTHDWVITYELMSRYHDVVVEDKALDGADLSAAWKYFQANYEKHVSGLRGVFFVVLDQESIEHLSSAPDEEELASMTPLERVKVAWQHWIKVVTTGYNYDHESMDMEYDIPSEGMGRRRIRLYDYLDIYLYLQHCDISEVGVEGSDRQRFPGYEMEDEWLICNNFDEQPEVWPWLEELYGEWKC